MVKCVGCERMVPAATRHDCPGGGTPGPSSVARASAPRQVDWVKLAAAVGLDATTATRADVAAAVDRWLNPRRAPVGSPLAAEALIQGAINAGKVPESRRGHWEAEYARDPAGTTAVIGQLAALPEMAAAPAPSGGQGWAERMRVAALDPVARLRATNPQVWRMASREGPPPTAFPEGDVPRMTVSGVDPGVLAGLPWQARIVAAHVSAVEVRRIIDEVSGPGGDLAAADLYGSHPAVRAFEQRVYDWAKGQPAGSQTPSDDVYSAMFPDGR